MVPFPAVHRGCRLNTEVLVTLLLNVRGGLLNVQIQIGCGTISSRSTLPAGDCLSLAIASENVGMKAFAELPSSLRVKLCWRLLSLERPLARLNLVFKDSPGEITIFQMTLTELINS